MMNSYSNTSTIANPIQMNFVAHNKCDADLNRMMICISIDQELANLFL